MPINEKMIQCHKPRWATLGETERKNGRVFFKTNTGYIVVDEKAVDEWRAEND